MPLEQTITVVNRSGKVISSGKHLLSIFKGAKASYQDKKAQLKSERASLVRAQTFDHTTTPRRQIEEYAASDNDYHDRHDRRHSHDRSRPPVTRHHDEYSEASTRHGRKPHRSRSVNGGHTRRRSVHGASRGPALTEDNLKAWSDVTSQAPSQAQSRAPSRAPSQHFYHSPYAETLPQDMAMSKMDLTNAHMRNMAAHADRSRSIMNPHRRSNPDFDHYDAETEYSSIGGGDRPYQLERRDSGKEVDMNMAYGDIPPDLEDRVDLDPAYKEQKRQDRARMLVRKVEGLLDEAHCVQHSAVSTIAHLQQNPEAAAAVALTLAELSSAVKAMSPGVITLLKSGSPAVFALLASPQFLIGTGIAVGVTVVMFGGWKIVKKVKEAQAMRQAIAYEGAGMGSPQGAHRRPPLLRAQTEGSVGVDEALLVDEELSTIETWRRGIMPSGADDESADYELITPVANRSTMERRRSPLQKGRGHDVEEDDDAQSRRSGTVKSSKTRKSHKSKQTTEHDDGKKKSSVSGSGSSSTGRHHHTGEAEAGRRGSKSDTGIGSSGGGSRDAKTGKKKTVKAIDDGTRSRAADEDVRSSLSKRPTVSRQGSNMLKAIFKKEKDKDARSVVTIG